MRLIERINNLKYHALKLYHTRFLDNIPKVYVPLSMIVIPCIMVVIYRIFIYIK